MARPAAGRRRPRLHKAAPYARTALGTRDAVVLAGNLVTLPPTAQVTVDVAEFGAAEDAAGTDPPSRRPGRVSGESRLRRRAPPGVRGGAAPGAGSTPAGPLAGPELEPGSPELATRLVGAADHALEGLAAGRDLFDVSEHERVVAALRSALGDDAYARLHAEGTRMSLDGAADLALADPDPAR